MEEKKREGGWIVDIERWEYIWMGEGPAPKFPHLQAIRWGVYFYLKGSLKGFPKRLYRVLKNVFTKSLKLSQAPSGYLANNKEGKCGTVSE